PECDVLVAGGGPGGLAAAISSARNGADTLLIERYGFLGGMATAGLVNPYMTYWAGDEQIVHGIHQEIIDRLTAMGAYGKGSRTAFDPEAYKFVADRMCEEAGVRVLLHTFLSDAIVENSHITAIETCGKSGKRLAKAKIYVDGTGDADLAFLAGARCEKGRQEDGLTQPMTLNFRVVNVNQSQMPPRGEEFNRLFEKAKAEGRLSCPRENVLFFYTTREGEIHFNQTRITHADGTSSEDLTRAEIEGRRQAWEFLEFLRRDVPGFEKAEILMSGPQVGVRETRRVIGEYILTAEDVLGARKFDDCIARGSYSIDIHNPAGPGTIIKHLPKGESYDIPYRCLVPLGIENLLIAGRPISATHEAHSSLRIMPICIAIGQAAGTAAALCATSGVSPRNLDVSLLQSKLREQGANLG
ncbi:MAG: FAD-dependent oxidoreductase, partial [Armatimonadota bacterium]|nr:FAD-dependent oxidoreductase [Armatimonadota bacterium]